MHLAGNGVSAAIERLEDVRQLGGRDAPAVIADGDPDFRTTTLPTMLDLDADPTIAATVLDGIGDQVLHADRRARRLPATVGGFGMIALDRGRARVRSRATAASRSRLR